MFVPNDPLIVLCLIEDTFMPFSEDILISYTSSYILNSQWVIIFIIAKEL